VSTTGRRLKKKITDAARKFFVEDFYGNKTLRLKKSPSLKVHVDVKEV